MGEKINIRGINFDSVDMAEAERLCRSFLGGGGGAKVIHTPNAEIVQLCVEKPEYLPLINSADLIIPDGAGVILASKILGRPLKKGKVAGIELCEKLVGVAAEEGKGVYFLGGKAGVAAEAARKLKEKYPPLIISGARDGFFKKADTLEKAERWRKGEIIAEDESVIAEINSSGAEMLLVCLGVPKQEVWMELHRNELKVKLMGGFGGSFDNYAGLVRRAPKIMIKLNLEWLYRLVKEPSRAGRMMKLPKFVIGTAAEAISHPAKNKKRKK